MRVRQARWRVRSVLSYGDARLISLVGTEPANVGVEQAVLAPFDDVEPIERKMRPRIVGPRRWRHTCRALLARCTSPSGLATPRDARIDLHPYQLEPALAVRRGLAQRVLLADAVGLGKTVQTGVIISELRARGAADRVLILTPPGLRDQWRAELGERFGLPFAHVDVAELRRTRAMLAAGANPWATLPLAIASIDYVKRSEVLAAVARCRWDVVVIDEAHHAVAGTDRHRAADGLACRAGHVVLVTATPHSGDSAAFSSLCAIGQVADDPLLVFRRTRQAVHIGHGRREHRLAVRPTTEERRMHEALDRFARAVRAEHGDGTALALSVLSKRAFSSVYALGQTVGRRLEALIAEPGGHARQLPLPLTDVAGELSAEDQAPAWAPELALRDTARERRMLTDIASAARAATRGDSKIAALHRLLRRIDEPAIVFTEYRDTLLHVAAGIDRPMVLHGGLSREERREALAAFTSGRSRVLLATDAAGEGLNLHQSCRLIVNLELPWNPTRLEQRIGRVDRIGQHRVVHAFLLVASAVGEDSMAERLDEKRAVASAELEGHKAVPELALDAVDEAARARAARLLADRHAVDLEEPLVLMPRRARTRARLDGRTVSVWTVRADDGGGRVACATVAGVSNKAGSGGRRTVVGLLEATHTVVGAHVNEALARWRHEVTSAHERFSSARLRRERAILNGPSRTAAPVQVELFHRRAPQAQDEDDDAERSARLVAIEREGTISFLPASLALAVVP